MQKIIDKKKMSEDVNAFLEHELSDNVELSQQISRACTDLGITFENFKSSAHDYAMFFVDEVWDNSVYNDIGINLAIYFCSKMRKSFNRIRHQVVFEWLKKVNPNSVIDCGYATPTDYMLDKKFISGRKIILVENSEQAEKVSRVIFDINGVLMGDILFSTQNMNDFEYVGDCDAYIFLDSIEHVSNPDKYLKVQVDNAKAGSYFIFSIPVAKIDSLMNIHYKEWKNDDEAKKWIKDNDLKILDSKIATPNPDVDIFARPILGGFHNILFLCQK